VREAASALAFGLAVASGCGPSEAAELRRARQDASAGIEAADRYCALRDSLLALPLAADRRDALMEEMLRAPGPVDDYCAHLVEGSPGH
jgi:hypothetical protein